MAGSKKLDIAEEIAARRKKAEKIAANHKIADVNEINEITNVLTCAVMALKDMRGKNNKPLSEKRILEIVAGHLDEALKYLEPERAFSMFSSSDVKKLVTVYIPYYNALTSKETPFYTREELAEVIQDFYRYLFSNKNFLLLCGYPRRSFEKSLYFDRLLSNLYPVKMQKPPEQGWSYPLPRGTRRSLFESGRVDAIIDASKILPAYEKVPLIEGLRDEDIDDIVENRMGIISLKMKVLDIAYKYLCQKEGIKSTKSGGALAFKHSRQKEGAKSTKSGGFFRECIEVFAENLDKEMLEKLNRIEAAYVKAMKDSRLRGSTKKSKEFGVGGIKDLLQFIFFVEEELHVGQMHNAKKALRDLTNAKSS